MPVLSHESIRANFLPTEMLNRHQAVANDDTATNVHRLSDYTRDQGGEQAALLRSMVQRLEAIERNTARQEALAARQAAKRDGSENVRTYQRRAREQADDQRQAMREAARERARQRIANMPRDERGRLMPRNGAGAGSGQTRSELMRVIREQLSEAAERNPTLGLLGAGARDAGRLAKHLGGRARDRFQRRAPIRSTSPLRRHDPRFSVLAGTGQVGDPLSVGNRPNSVFRGPGGQGQGGGDGGSAIGGGIAGGLAAKYGGTLARGAGRLGMGALRAAPGIAALGGAAYLANQAGALRMPDSDSPWHRQIMETLDPGLARRIYGDKQSGPGGAPSRNGAAPEPQGGTALPNRAAPMGYDPTTGAGSFGPQQAALPTMSAPGIVDTNANFGSVPLNLGSQTSAATTDANILQGSTYRRAPNANVQDAMERAARDMNVDPRLVWAKGAVESSYNANANAGISSAAGLGQILTGTWDEIAKDPRAAQYGIRAGDYASRYDPYKSAAASMIYSQNNIERLKGKGLLTDDQLKQNPGLYYIPHNLGPEGAERFLKGMRENPDARVSSVLTAKEIANNPSIYMRDGNQVRTFREAMAGIESGAFGQGFRLRDQQAATLGAPWQGGGNVNLPQIATRGAAGTAAQIADANGVAGTAPGLFNTQPTGSAADRVMQAQLGTNKTRNQAIQDNLKDQLQFAAERAGVEVEVGSGGQTSERDPHMKDRPGGWTGSHRHDEGGSADVQLYRRDAQGNRVLLSDTNETDRAQMQRFATEAVRAGATGIGAAHNYMGPSTMHIGGGSAAVWGAKGGSPAEWIAQAHREGMAAQQAGGKAEFEAWREARRNGGTQVADQGYVREINPNLQSPAVASAGQPDNGVLANLPPAPPPPPADETPLVMRITKALGNAVVSSAAAAESNRPPVAPHPDANALFGGMATPGATGFGAGTGPAANRFTSQAAAGVPVAESEEDVRRMEAGMRPAFDAVPRAGESTPFSVTHLPPQPGFGRVMRDEEMGDFGSTQPGSAFTKQMPGSMGTATSSGFSGSAVSPNSFSGAGPAAHDPNLNPFGAGDNRARAISDTGGAVQQGSASAVDEKASQVKTPNFEAAELRGSPSVATSSIDPPTHFGEEEKVRITDINTMDEISTQLVNGSEVV